MSCSPLSDAECAALPKAQFNAPMADPKALADVLRAHIVEGYYPFGRGHVERTGTNLAA